MKNLFTVRVQKSEIFYFLTLLTLPIIALLLPIEELQNYSYVLYFAQQILFFRIFLKYRYIFLLMTPIMLILFYINISFGIASFAYANNFVYEKGDLAGFYNWQHLNFTTFYVLTSSSILFFTNYLLKSQFTKILNIQKIQISNNILNYYIFIAIVFLLVFSKIPLNIEFLGGSGDLSMIPKTVSVLLLIYITAYKNYKYRVFLYLGILIFFASFSFSSKREAIFLIFSMLLIESIVNKLKFKFKFIFIGVLIILFVVLLILIMSLMRGYGGYIKETDVVSVFLAMSYLKEYVTSDLFLVYFLNNLEVNATYFHSINAMEYVINDISKLEFGSTIIKVFFITIPSSIIDFKPDSMLNLYALTKDPVYRSIGGSWPVNIYAEYFWNFHIFGILVIPFFFYYFSLFFVKIFTLVKSGNIVYHSWMLYAYMELITFVRGSGFEMYVIYMLFAFFFSMIYVITQKIIFKNNLSIKF